MGSLVRAVMWAFSLAFSENDSDWWLFISMSRSVWRSEGLSSSKICFSVVAFNNGAVCESVLYGRIRRALDRLLRAVLFVGAFCMV
jgi:hypothetical protein